MIEFFKKIFFSTKYEKILEKKIKQAKDLDKRYMELERATLNGEDSWFSMVKKKDPECVIKILTNCPENDHGKSS